jgi:hypothetical protein
MSVRFASANHPARRLGWRAAGRGLVAPALARAVNDNADGAADAAEGFDPMLAEALRHFAVHGLASTKAALEEAQAASARGDGDAKDHWLGIAAMFDRRARVRFEPA